MTRDLLATWPPAALLAVQLSGSSTLLVALFVIGERKAGALGGPYTLTCQVPTTR